MARRVARVLIGAQSLDVALDQAIQRFGHLRDNGLLLAGLRHESTRGSFTVLRDIAPQAERKTILVDGYAIQFNRAIKTFVGGRQPAELPGKAEHQGDPLWALESSLDVQWAHAIAPNARIVLVEAASSSLDDLMSAIAIALATRPAPGGLGAKVVSISWRSPELLSETQYDGKFASANGVSFVAASGDGGNGVDYPAASPYVLSVSGTSIATDVSGAYAAETAWAGSGGGQSAVEPEPTYQSNFGMPSDSLGLPGVPGVAYDADPASGFAVYDS